MVDVVRESRLEMTCSRRRTRRRCDQHLQLDQSTTTKPPTTDHHVFSPRPRRRHRAPAEHAARVPLLDRARLAGRHRHDRARRRTRRRSNGADPAHLRRRHRRVQLHRPRSRRCTTSSGTTARRERAAFAATDRAEIRLYTAAVLRQIPEEPLQPVPMGAGVPRRRRRRRRRAAHGRLPASEGAHTGIPIGVYRAGGTDVADLSRRRLPPRARGGAPQHHRRLGARDEDQRGRVAALVDLRALPGAARDRSPRSAST